MSLEFKNLKSKKEKLRHEKDELLKNYANALKIEVFESAQKICSNISELQRTVKLLKYEIEKMVYGSKNLDLMLGNQISYFEKLELRYTKEESEKLSKSSQHKVPTCIYCFKKGHSFEKCFLRRKEKK